MIVVGGQYAEHNHDGQEEKEVDGIVQPQSEDARDGVPFLKIDEGS